MFSKGEGFVHVEHAWDLTKIPYPRTIIAIYHDKKAISFMCN